MEVDEKYLGGLESPYLNKGWPKTGGYAIHVTTKRIIGVKKRGDAFSLDLGASKRVKGETQRESKLERDNTSEEMKKLLEAKDIEIRKQEIKQIRLKKVGTLTPGHLIIALNSGEETKIDILQQGRHLDYAYPGPRLFEKIEELMQAFYPEAVQLEN
jgi:hypothetical protein